MTHLTYAQMEGVWINNGGNKAMAPLMAAVGEVESGGNTDAENPSGATGLWQIEWPLHQGIVPGATSRQALFDPNINAKAAIKLSGNVNSAAPGSPVYNNWLVDEPPGAYKAFIKNSTTPDTNVPGGSGATSATLTATQSAECLIASPSVNIHITTLGGGCLISKTQARAVLGGIIVTGGVIVGGVGVVLLAAFGFGKSSAGQKAIAAAQLVPGVGPAAKVAGAAVSSSGGSRARRAPPVRESSSAAPPA